MEEQANNSLNFMAISNSGMKIVHTLLRNQNFLKLSRLMVEYPTSQYCRMEELLMDAISSGGSQDGLFVLTPSVEAVALEKRVYIHFFPYKPASKIGISLADGVHASYYAMNIFVPNDYALIEDGTQWRSFAIFNEVSKSIHGKRITGIGQVQIVDWESLTVKNNPSFSSLSCVIGVNHATAHQAFEI